LKIDKLVSYFYALIKICSRDIYIVPKNNINDIFKISLILLLSNLSTYILGVPRLMNTNGVILGTLLLFIIKEVVK